MPAQIRVHWADLRTEPAAVATEARIRVYQAQLRVANDIALIRVYWAQLRVGGADAAQIRVHYAALLVPDSASAADVREGGDFQPMHIEYRNGGVWQRVT